MVYRLKEIISVVFCSFLGFKSLASTSKMVEISSIKDVVKYVDQNTLILFDLDKTLISANTSYGSADWFYCLIEEDIKKGLSKDESIMNHYPQWVASQNVITPIVTEPDLQKTIYELQTSSLLTQGLTSRQPSVSKPTLLQLNTLGITFPTINTISITNVKYPVLYKNGVIFAHDLNSKGSVFTKWFDQAKTQNSDVAKVEKIIFVDDSKKHVIDMYDAVSRFPNIQYIGLHFTGFQPLNFDCSMAKHEESILQKNLSDKKLENN